MRATASRVPDERSRFGFASLSWWTGLLRTTHGYMSRESGAVTLIDLSPLTHHHSDHDGTLNELRPGNPPFPFPPFPIWPGNGKGIPDSA
jgi:hypothetical protein